MENKEYFTPDIEDLHIGYELEAKVTNYPDKNNWIPMTLQGFTKVQEYYEKGIYRVPYLNKEQIEAEGWKHIGGKMLSGAEQIYSKGIFTLYYTTSNLKLQVVNDEEDWSSEVQGGVKFEGFCKDINTFRKIIKLLGI